MSLTDFTDFASEVFDDCFAKPSFRGVKGELKAIPLTKNYATVGTAFDYSLRLVINKTNKRFISNFPLVARHGITNKKRIQFISEFENKKAAFLEDKIVITELLPDCIILAHLDSIYRSGQNFPDSVIFQVNQNDVIDLANLIELANPKFFTAKQQCFLNPTFKNSSVDVGGADADLIIDDTLIDIKTTKYLEFKRPAFRQLIGYWWLNQREHSLYNFSKLAIYFSRYGVFYAFPADLCLRTDKEECFYLLEWALTEYNKADWDSVPIIGEENKVSKEIIRVTDISKKQEEEQ